MNALSDGSYHHRVPYAPLFPSSSSVLRPQAVKQVADAGGVQIMTGMDFESLRGLLESLFKVRIGSELMSDM